MVKSMQKLEEELKKMATNSGAYILSPVNPGEVVVGNWVRLKCQYGCPGFGQSLCCPPYSPTPDKTRKVIDSYREAILLHCGLRKGEKRGQKAKIFKDAVVRLEIEMFWAEYYKPGAWDAAPATFAKNVMHRAPAGMGTKQGLRWRHVASMSSRLQGTMGFPLKLFEHPMKNEISSGWFWSSEAYTETAG